MVVKSLAMVTNHHHVSGLSCRLLDDALDRIDGRQRRASERARVGHRPSIDSRPQVAQRPASSNPRSSTSRTALRYCSSVESTSWLWLS